MPLLRARQRPWPGCVVDQVASAAMAEAIDQPAVSWWQRWTAPRYRRGGDGEAGRLPQAARRQPEVSRQLPRSCTVAAVTQASIHRGVIGRNRCPNGGRRGIAVSGDAATSEVKHQEQVQWVAAFWWSCSRRPSCRLTRPSRRPCKGGPGEKALRMRGTGPVLTAPGIENAAGWRRPCGGPIPAPSQGHEPDEAQRLPRGRRSPSRRVRRGGRLGVLVVC